MNRRDFLTATAAGGVLLTGARPALGAPATGGAFSYPDAGGSGVGKAAPLANRRVVRVCFRHASPVVRFAAEELVRYLHAISGATAIHFLREGYEAEDDTLWIGVISDFPGLAAPEVADPGRDDAMVIHVEGRRGIIAGANPRAALLAAYRYLTELGCRWIRPGRDGEYLPVIEDPLAREVRLTEKPAYRHRGISMEGACSSEHVIATVDWMAKVGMNSGFLEYTNAYIYYNNWYSARHLPENSTKLMPDDTVSEIADCAIAEMKRRGMLVHRMGHGWTCMVLGIPSELWDEPIQRDFGDKTRFIAEYQGHRQLFLGIPRRTHLCYSQAEVRSRLAAEIVRYAADHPEVDYVHYWLADGTNHCCECADCRKARPADFYVMTLNEIDAELTRRNLPTRVAFLAYADLLWPPEKEVFRNPDRFLLMFAPINRSYLEPFRAEGLREPIPPFVLNRLQFPQSQNLNFLAGWQKVFPGDSFIYDYRFMWFQYDDPGYMEWARATAQDIPMLGRVGLNGMISDQTERVYLPSGLPMMILARLLVDDRLEYQAMAADYFAAAFGADGGACRDYLQAISEQFDPRWMGEYKTRDHPKVPPGTARRLQKVRRITADFRPVIERNLRLPVPCQALSWKYLSLHAQICDLMSRALETEIQGDQAGAIARWQELEKFVVRHEGECHPAFDVFLFLLSLKRKQHPFSQLPAVLKPEE